MTGAPSLWLSRARLRQDAGLAALGPLLLPPEDDRRADAAHRLVWSLFADAPDRARDFLWREEAPGHFLILSGRPPAEDGPLFAVESKAFAPALATGDRLAFLLRANATTAVRQEGRRGKPADVVMHALHALPQGERAARRADAVREAGTAWLERQGERHGFRVDPGTLAVEGHDIRQVPRRSAAPIRYAVLDLAGHLEVRQPDLFLAAVARGFGRARAFGCGLMLIRRP